MILSGNLDDVQPLEKLSGNDKIKVNARLEDVPEHDTVLSNARAPKVANTAIDYNGSSIPIMQDKLVHKDRIAELLQNSKQKVQPGSRSRFPIEDYLRSKGCAIKLFKCDDDDDELSTGDAFEKSFLAKQDRPRIDVRPVLIKSRMAEATPKRRQRPQERISSSADRSFQYRQREDRSRSETQQPALVVSIPTDDQNPQQQQQPFQWPQQQQQCQWVCFGSDQLNYNQGDNVFPVSPSSAGSSSPMSWSPVFFLFFV